ncbi:MAG: LarC family nickel insertion protein [Janthinobacterium lividum]
MRMPDTDASPTHLHLDALGGMAGDMFVAAVLDAFPEHEPGVRRSVAAVDAGMPVECRLVPHHDGTLQGHRFTVALSAAPVSPHHSHGPSSGHHHAHEADHHAPHRHWTSIRTMLEKAALDPVVREHAIGMFTQLAEAEGRVHGISPAEVSFHEVGAWDSIADIVAAAHLAAVLAPVRWTVGPLPPGRGRVHTAHGWLPVPAPATALLLRGFEMLDDGIEGERVTPTGAAILKHFCGEAAAAPAGRPARLGRLGRTGIGFGTRVLPGVPNCVRVLAYAQTAPAESAHRELGVIEFEVDDQSAEELAMGLDRLRSHADVFDVVQMPVFGKKGRIMTHVRALVRAAAMDAAIAACFRETTTIGLRHYCVSGSALPRRASTVDVDGRPVRVKMVERPGGWTAKAEADDVLAVDGHTGRAALRREAERRALAAGDFA